MEQTKKQLQAEWNKMVYEDSLAAMKKDRSVLHVNIYTKHGVLEIISSDILDAIEETMKKEIAHFQSIIDGNKFVALKHGVYKINWKGGGSSLASVGSTATGKRWYAPCNWTSNNESVPGVATTDWESVESVELIKENNYGTESNT